MAHKSPSFKEFVVSDIIALFFAQSKSFLADGTEKMTAVMGELIVLNGQIAH